jgi:hypothetical protein
MGSFLGGAASGPQYAPPLPAAPPPAPTPVDQTTVDAASRSKAALAAQGGYSSTILTGGQGVQDKANVASPQLKTMLGQ